MSFLSLKLLGCVLLALAIPALGETRQLRVCADPDNLPFSNRKQQGFENRIADLLAQETHAQLRYVWQRMGRGFVREYFGKSRCDLVVGIPSSFTQLLTTKPYYRSTYVFVSRRSAHMQPTSMDDPALRRMKIGVQVLDEDYAPPAAALAYRGMQSNIVGFDTTGSDAPSIIRAVATRQIDTAIVWGPLAGYFAQRYPGKLSLTPVRPVTDAGGIPFSFSISMGVRKDNILLRNELQQFLARRHGEIDAILHRYGVPRIDQATAVARGN